MAVLLPALQNLQSLTVIYRKLTVETMESFTALKKLTHIGFDYMRLGQRKTAAIGNLHQLTSLSLDFCFVGAAGFASFR